MKKQAFVVVDLAYGDCGKGTVTDALVRKYKSDLVIRYNGACQCAHNVTTDDGRHHTFRQFGSGTFVPGCRTLLGQDMLIEPMGMQIEDWMLSKVGVPDAFARMQIDERCLIITPYHAALNQLREIARGADRHGSCGQGIGETVRDAQEHPHMAIHASDLRNLGVFQAKLVAARDRLTEEALKLGIYSQHGIDLNIEIEAEVYKALRTPIAELMPRYKRFASECSIATPDAVDNIIRTADTIVCEGAQGILLDQNYGFHPYTTWTTTTSSHAHGMLFPHFDGDIYDVGVARTYMTRHGRGPFPTEDSTDPHLRSATGMDHNKTNTWQEQFRRGWLDLVALRYAVEVNGGVDFLAVTHADTLNTRTWWPVVDRYPWPEFHPQEKIDLDQQEILTKALMGLTARGIATASFEIIDRMCQALEAPVMIQSHGPQYKDKIFFPVPLGLPARKIFLQHGPDPRLENAAHANVGPNQAA